MSAILNFVRGMFVRGMFVRKDIECELGIQYDCIEIEMDPGAAGTITFRLDGVQMVFFDMGGGETFRMHFPQAKTLEPKERK